MQKFSAEAFLTRVLYHDDSSTYYFNPFRSSKLKAFVLIIPICDLREVIIDNMTYCQSVMIVDTVDCHVDLTTSKLCRKGENDQLTTKNNGRLKEPSHPARVRADINGS